MHKRQFSAERMAQIDPELHSFLPRLVSPDQVPPSAPRPLPPPPACWLWDPLQLLPPSGSSREQFAK